MFLKISKFLYKYSDTNSILYYYKHKYIYFLVEDIFLLIELYYFSQE